MKGYLKLFLIWVVAYLVISIYDEFLLKKDVNGFIQLFGFVSIMFGLFYLVGKTIKTFKE